MKQKPKSLLIFLMIFFIAGFKAQQAVTSGGGDGSGSGGTVSFSTGQVAYTSITGSSGSVNQGVQQAYEITVVGLDENQHIDLMLAAYPNPVLSTLKLQVNDFDFTKMSYNVYDVSGRIMLHGDISQVVTNINMDTLANATYYLSVLENKKEIKLFQIIKHD